jgi:hypothetical protein
MVYARTFVELHLKVTRPVHDSLIFQYFVGATYLLAWADEIIEIKTICHCGKKATFNARIGPDGQMQQAGEQIVIGVNSLYISLCRKHFRSCQVTSGRAALPAVPTVHLSSPHDPQPSQFSTIIDDDRTRKHLNSNAEGVIEEDDDQQVKDDILNAYASAFNDDSQLNRFDSGILISD